MTFRNFALLGALLLSAGPALAQVSDFSRPMITEVTWGGIDGVEITNFAPAPVSINGWRVRWQDSTFGVSLSSLLSGSLAPGEIMIVKEPSSGLYLETPPGIRVETAFGPLPTTSQQITVTLQDDFGGHVDEVQVADIAGNHTIGGPGIFRGEALRPNAVTNQGSVERIWSLDSNGGADWTGQAVTSMGLENLNNGIVGNDILGISGDVKITEIDDSPDFIELRNVGTGQVNLSGWFLYTSGLQNQPVTIIKPFPNNVFVPAGGFIVLGETPTPPAELPATVPYVDVSENIPFSTGEYAVALYDFRGKLVDLVRTTGDDDNVIHNHPRMPSRAVDFVGAARRSTLGSGAIGLVGSDGDDGNDWRPVDTRTMGSPNNNFFVVPANGPTFDVRLNATRTGDGLTVIIDAGPLHAGEIYSYLFSVGHSMGQGPFLGLGPDALANWLVLREVPPFAGVLDADGAGRFDFPAGTLPPGLDVDHLFLLQDGAGLITALTPILELDT